MNLDATANVARQALIASQNQIALSGRNVAAAGDASRSRAIAVMVTTVDGGVRVGDFRRAEDSALYGRMLQATSASAGADTVLTHLGVPSATVGDPEDGVSVSARIGDMMAAIQDYANAPQDANFGRAAVERARDVANALNEASDAILRQQEQADANMANSVDQVNKLLAAFDNANRAVIKAVANGEDGTLWQDQRDAIVTKLSEHMGVSVLRRNGGDVALYTDSGITLFDRIPRKVEFVRTPVFTNCATGGVVKIDGMAATGPDSAMPLQTGTIAGNALVRDTIAPVYQRQMNEIARALEATFADGPGSLFTTSGGPDYARSIRVAAPVDPTQGGSPVRLRDGTANPGGLASYSARLLALGEAMTQPQSFDPTTQLAGSATLSDYASSSAGWLENVRQVASATADKEGAILSGASQALSNATGVNLDDEYAQQLAIERSFAASSKLITMIDEMFKTLLEMAR